MTRARIGLALGSAVFAALPSAAFAQEGRFNVDVAATAGYSNNPFSIVGDDTGAALVGLDILPQYTIRGERSVVSLTGAARFQQYLRRYSNNDSYSGAIDYRTQVSERLSAHTRLALSSAVLGGNDTYLPAFVDPSLTSPAPVPGAPAIPATGAGALDPGVFVPGFNDVGLFGLRNRRRSVTLGGDASYALSARDALTASAFAEAARYSQLALATDYEGYGGTVGYSRQLSAGLRLGLQGSVSAFDYRIPGRGSQVYTVQGTGSARIDQYWTLSGSLGVSFVDSGAADSTRQTSLSGDLNLCRQGERTLACVQASRQVRPTGLVGTQYVTAAGANWSLRLGEREHVSWTASYSKVGGDGQLLFPGQAVLQNEYARFSAGYDRQLTQRLAFVASANFRQIFGDGLDRSADYGGQVGLSYRFGDLR